METIIIKIKLTPFIEYFSSTARLSLRWFVVCCLFFSLTQLITSPPEIRLIYSVRTNKKLSQPGQPA